MNINYHTPNRQNQHKNYDTTTPHQALQQHNHSNVNQRGTFRSLTPQESFQEITDAPVISYNPPPLAVSNSNIKNYQFQPILNNQVKNPHSNDNNDNTNLLQQNNTYTQNNTYDNQQLSTQNTTQKTIQDENFTHTYLPQNYYNKNDSLDNKNSPFLTQQNDDMNQNNNTNNNTINDIQTNNNKDNNINNDNYDNTKHNNNIASYINNNAHIDVSKSCDFLDYKQEFLIPEKKCKRKWTMVLDLDETLIHTFNIDPLKLNFYTRPNSHNFLTEMSKHFELIVFTAASEDYANPIINYLDPQNVISHKLFREAMRIHQGILTKDLTVLGRDLQKTFLVDNLQSNFNAQPQNGYLIPDFFGKKDDEEIEILILFLKKMIDTNCEDVTQFLQNKEKILQEIKQKKEEKYQKNEKEEEQQSMTSIGNVLESKTDILYQNTDNQTEQKEKQ